MLRNSHENLNETNKSSYIQYSIYIYIFFPKNAEEEEKRTNQIFFYITYARLVLYAYI